MPLFTAPVYPDVPKQLYQGTIGSSAAAFYTVPTAKQTRYETLRLYNSDTVAQTITVYDGGSAAGNTILPVTEIPAGDFIELDLTGMGQQAGGTLQAVASVAAKIVATLYGSEEDPGVKLYKKLAQVTLAAGWNTLVSSFANRTRVSHVRVANTDSVTRGVGFADGGTAATNQIQDAASVSAQIPAGGVMEVQSYLGFASGGSLSAAPSGGTALVVTVYGIEG